MGIAIGCHRIIGLILKNQPGCSEHERDPGLDVKQTKRGPERLRSEADERLAPSGSAQDQGNQENGKNNKHRVDALMQFGGVGIGFRGHAICG